MLARLDREVPPPIGDVALVFTDIKNSTLLWESYPANMRSAIKTHNTIMRRSLRNVGGYEVKTEGDAFMVCFPTITTAVTWCFMVQSQLLTADWPQEILDSEHGKGVYDTDSGTLLYRGLSVRMGIHFGAPVCEVDPITKRMDYFGPMVNRAARICTEADGGQIAASADVVRELESIEHHMERRDSSDTIASSTSALFKDMAALKASGFTVAPIGERKLKGLENTEYLYLICQKTLSGRLQLARLLNSDEEISPGPDQVFEMHSSVTIQASHIRSLNLLCKKLEKLNSVLSFAETYQDSPILIRRINEKIRDEDDQASLLQSLDSLVTRVEVSASFSSERVI